MPKPTSTCHILIAGLGKLGTALARQLQADGHRVSGIRRQDIPVDGVDLYPQDLVSTPFVLLPPDQVDLLVIILTPATRDETGYRDSFLIAPQKLVQAIAKQQLMPPIIFVSSTAVYGNSPALDNQLVTEDTPPQPDEFNGKILLAAEQELSLAGLLTCVRFAGIYGQTDYWTQQAIAIAKGEKPLPPARWMNRIHHTQCVELLYQLATGWLAQQPMPPVVNGCDNQPVSNHNLLEKLATQAGFELTIPNTPPSGKRIKGHLISSEQSSAVQKLTGWS